MYNLLFGIFSKFADSDSSNELRCWLFHPSLAVLRGVLPTEQCVHYLQLVVGCRFPCGSYISAEQITLSRKQFLKFYQVC